MQRSSQREIRDFPSDNKDCKKKPERQKKFSERGCMLKSREARLSWGKKLKRKKKKKALKPVRRIGIQKPLGVVGMTCAFASAVHIPSCVHGHFVG